MTIQSFAISGFLATGVLGGWDHMKSDFEAIKKNSSDRAVTNLMGDTLELIQNYGCWCYFDDNHGKGKSQPINDVDAFCKLLHEGYDCAIIDGDMENEPCTPWEVDYNSAPTTSGDIIAECESRNDNSCSTRACIVESVFIGDIFKSFIRGNQHDAKYLHENDFDVATECPTKDGVPHSNRACCGVYPFRHPFKTYDGERGCCGSKTFDTNILTCCDDGRAKMSCE